MSDIIEEARALLARLNEGAFAWGNAHANQQGERLLAALADECERLRDENARMREAMPTDEEWAHMQEARAEDKLNAECPDHIASNRIIDRWLARLDAAKGVR